MLQKGYSLNEFPNKGLVVSIRNRMQCRGKEKASPVGKDKRGRGQKQTCIGFSCYIWVPIPPPINCSGLDSKEETYHQVH